MQQNKKTVHNKSETKLKSTQRKSFFIYFCKAALHNVSVVKTSIQIKLNGIKNRKLNNSEDTNKNKKP